MLRAHSTDIFKAIIRETMLSQKRQYRSDARTIQSSVGLIFKTSHHNPIASLSSPLALLESQISTIKLLFTQRAGYQHDQNAYNIVFPGGQCDNDETDFEACKRQLQEEIGLKVGRLNKQVDEQCLYVGQVPSNFYYLQKRGKSLYITCHVWVLRAGQEDWDVTLNQAELRDYRWVPLEELLERGNYVWTQKGKMGAIERMVLRYEWQRRIKRNIECTVMPELELGMDRNLWGLTLWIWNYVLQMGIKNLSLQKTQDGRVEELKAIQQHMSGLQVRFLHPATLFKYPIIGGVKLWHYWFRRRPFTYVRGGSWHRGRIQALVMLLMLLAVIWRIFL